MENLKELIDQVNESVQKRKIDMFLETANSIMSGELQTPSEAIEYMNWIEN
jgi:hypothetical protein